MAATPMHRFPTTFYQEEALGMHRDGRSAYNLVIGLRFEGSFDEQALATALEHLVARHETLRTIFVPGEPAEQHVAAAGQLPLERRRLPPSTTADDDRLIELMAQDLTRPFDVWGSPLARVTLARLSADCHGVWLTLHHAAADGWSLRVLARDLARLYQAAVTGDDPCLPRIPLGMGDLATWERSDLGERLAHWRRELAGRKTGERLGIDGRALPPRWVLSERTIASAPTSERLRALASSSGTSMSVVLTAALAAALAGLPRRDVVIGQFRSSRELADLRMVAGVVVDIVPVRVAVSDDPPFETLLERVRAAEHAGRAQRVPFGALKRALGDDGTDRTRPVVDAFLNYQPMAPSGSAWPGPEGSGARIVEVTLPPARLVWAVDMADLCIEPTLRVVADERGLIGEVHPDPAFAANAELRDVERTVVAVLTAVACNPTARLSQLRRRSVQKPRS